MTATLRRLFERNVTIRGCPKSLISTRGTLEMGKEPVEHRLQTWAYPATLVRTRTWVVGCQAHQHFQVPEPTTPT
jgi:hypothetical protein